MARPPRNINGIEVDLSGDLDNVNVWAPAETRLTPTRLTPTEARALAAWLQEAADLADRFRAAAEPRRPVLRSVP
jgi:type II secretory pathway component PulM